MTKLITASILGLILVSSSFADEEARTTFLWQYKNGKAAGEVRLAQSSAPDSPEFEYRQVMWTPDGRYAMLAKIVQSNEDGTYRAVYKITRTGGAAAEDWQLVLMTGKSYQQFLNRIHDPESRLKYGLKEECPREADALLATHDTVTKKTHGYCLIPQQVKLKVPPSKKPLSPDRKS